MFKVIERLLFSFFHHWSIMYAGNILLRKCVFKASGRLLFNLFGNFSNTKNVCSKQAVGCFLIYSSLIKRLMLYHEKRVFKASRGLLFSLYIINQTSDVLLWKLCVQSKRGLLLSLSIIISIVRLIFYYEKCGKLNQYCANFINFGERMIFKLLLFCFVSKL